MRSHYLCESDFNAFEIKHLMASSENKSLYVIIRINPNDIIYIVKYNNDNEGLLFTRLENAIECYNKC